MTLDTKKKLKAKGARILHLTLKRPPFDVMKTGEKHLEYRKGSKWILSRLFDQKKLIAKNYDFICFKNGYNMDSEFFYTKFNGYYEAFQKENIMYSNGLKVTVEKGDVVICCGKVCTLEEVLTFIDKKNEDELSTTNSPALHNDL